MEVFFIFNLACVLGKSSGTYGPSKHAGSDPEVFWLWPVMAIMASVQLESVRTVIAGSDFPHQFQFCFSKEGMGHTVHNWRGSSLDGLVSVLPNTSGLEASRCEGVIRPGVWQDATGLLLVSHFQTQLHSSTDTLDNIIQNQPRFDLVLADCARFWPNGSGSEASQCARTIRPSSGQCFSANLAQMRIGSGMFTGDLLTTACSSMNHAQLDCSLFLVFLARSTCMTDQPLVWVPLLPISVKGSLERRKKEQHWTWPHFDLRSKFFVLHSPYVVGHSFLDPYFSHSEIIVSVWLWFDPWCKNCVVKVYLFIIWRKQLDKKVWICTMTVLRNVRAILDDGVNSFSFCVCNFTSRKKEKKRRRKKTALGLAFNVMN